eukprot:scaffold103740_cov19-Prasinocladus_malaysianus.AAC.1
MSTTRHLVAKSLEFSGRWTGTTDFGGQCTRSEYWRKAASAVSGSNFIARPELVQIDLRHSNLLGIFPASVGHWMP